MIRVVLVIKELDCPAPSTLTCNSPAPGMLIAGIFDSVGIFTCGISPARADKITTSDISCLKSPAAIAPADLRLNPCPVCFEPGHCCFLLGLTSRRTGHPGLSAEPCAPAPCATCGRQPTGSSLAPAIRVRLRHEQSARPVAKASTALGLITSRSTQATARRPCRPAILINTVQSQGQHSCRQPSQPCVVFIALTPYGYRRRGRFMRYE